jgi:hypothetical protein
MSDSSPTLASSLLESASAVAALGACAGDLAVIDDASVVAGMGLVRDLRRALQSYELGLSAEIAKRSDHTLGYQGLARRSGSATPAIFIQSLTGSSIEEATKLARLGQSMVEATIEGTVESTVEGTVEGAGQSPVVVAAVAGGISVDAADAIRRGLGRPDAAVTVEQLAVAARELIARASGTTPEALLKAARRMRTDLDLDAIERGEKARAGQRYVRLWSWDGLSGGSWCLPDEDGGGEVNTALKLLLAKTNGGEPTPETGYSSAGTTTCSSTTDGPSPPPATPKTTATGTG